MFLQAIKHLTYSFRDLLFPPICLHCKKTVLDAASYLCNECTNQLELIDPLDRCPRCFSSEHTSHGSVCLLCQSKAQEAFLHQSAAAFDYVGPPASIIRKLKYGNQPYLAKGAGAFLVTQLLRLDWPLPDVIVPVPLSLTHWLNRGYNQSLLLAQSAAKILNKPVNTSLKRKSGDYSQAGLNRQQRAGLTAATFYLEKSNALNDKRILLIDDVMTTGSTLERCAEVLCEGCPSDIYALTFCRATK